MNQRQLGEWQVAFDDNADKNKQERGAVGHAPDRVVDLWPHACGEEGRGEQGVEGSRTEVVRHGVIAPPDEVREHHHQQIAGKRGPGAGHEAVVGHEEHDDGYGHHAPGGGEVGAPLGAVGQLVPHREVEVDAEKQLPEHDDGHDAEAGVVAGVDVVLEQVEVEGDAEEDDPRKDDEVTHRLDVRAAVVGVAGLGEDEGLVSVAEGLDEHDHHDGDLEAGAVDAQLRVGLGLVGKEEGEEDLVGRLIEDAGDAQDQDREGVGQHLSEACCVGAGAEAGHHVGQQHEQRGGGGKDVGQEDVSDAVARAIEPRDPLGVRLVQLRTDDKEEDVQHNVEEDVGQFDGGKSHGFVAVSEVGEGQAAKGVDGHNAGHHAHVFRVLGVAQCATDGPE